MLERFGLARQSWVGLARSVMLSMGAVRQSWKVMSVQGRVCYGRDRQGEAWQSWKGPSSFGLVCLGSER